MKRSHRAAIALVVLLALTGASLFVSEADAGPWPIAGLTVLKAVLIAGVFLEMDRSWPGWALTALVVVAGIAGGAALLIAG
jgi:hypothetical protein